METVDLDFEVTQEDIDKARECKNTPGFSVASSCPTAQAFRRLGYDGITVGPGGSYVWKKGVREVYEHSPALISQINNWDFRGTFSPVKTVLSRCEVLLAEKVFP